MIEHPGEHGFIWFLGIVDDINDPLQLGRIKVRVINEHENTVESEDLPWAIVLGSTTSASYLGLGSAPVGIQIGSRVLGFYLDDLRKTKPVVIGTMPFIKDGVDADHSVSAVARGKGPIEKSYLDYEPKTAYKAEYPYNKTISTISGHLIEVDDTPKSERIHVYHNSGSYVEMFPDGRIVIKSMKDCINISNEDQNIISDTGRINLSAKEDINIASQDNDIAINSAGGDIGINSTDGGVLIAGSSEIEINSDGNVSIKGGTIKLNGSITLTGDVNVKGSLRVNGRPVDLK